MDTDSLVDDLSVTLGIYGEDLEPQEIARILGVEPSDTVRRGEPIGPRGERSRHSAYLLTREAETQEEVSLVLEELFTLLPDSEELWASLKSRFKLQIRFGAGIYRTYSGFGVSAAQIDRLARMKVDVEIDVHVMSEEDSQSSSSTVH